MSLYTQCFVSHCSFCLCLWMKACFGEERKLEIEL